MFETIKRYDGFRLDHPNFQDVYETVYKKGVVTSYDTAEDTCVVEDFGTLPVFYHCGKVTELRGGGAIKGGSTSLWETETGTDPPEVIVVVIDDRPKYVIGFADHIPRICCFEPFESKELTALNEWEIEKHGALPLDAKMKQYESFWRLLIEIGPYDGGGINVKAGNVTVKTLSPKYPGSEDPILCNSTMIFEWNLEKMIGDSEFNTVEIVINGDHHIKLYDENTIRYELDEKHEIELEYGDSPITSVAIYARLVQEYICPPGETLDAHMQATFKYLCFRPKYDEQQ